MTVRVAIIGSGPSGFYTADALLRSGADVEINVIKRCKSIVVNLGKRLNRNDGVHGEYCTCNDRWRVPPSAWYLCHNTRNLTHWITQDD